MSEIRTSRGKKAKVNWKKVSILLFIIIIALLLWIVNPRCYATDGTSVYLQDGVTHIYQNGFTEMEVE